MSGGRYEPDLRDPGAIDAPVVDEVAAIRRRLARSDDFWRKLVSDSVILLIAFFVTTVAVGYATSAWWAVEAGAIGTAVTIFLSALGARKGAAIEQARAEENARADRRRSPPGGGAPVTAAVADPHALGHGGHPERERDEGGIAPKRIIVGYGFWLFLVSDIILFSGFFAAYAVLANSTDGGPTGAQLFELPLVAVETGLLLLSTVACGLATLAAEHRAMMWAQVGLLVTGLLGFGFLCIELYEFVHLIGQGAGPQRSAFLSAFFALVGCHGLHVSVGLLWCGTMMAQVWAKGFRENVQRRLLCFGLFWHALDIVWVGVFTIVYLLGARG